MACLGVKRSGMRCRNYACLEEQDGQLVRGFTCQAHSTYFSDREKATMKWFRSTRQHPALGMYMHFHPSLCTLLDELFELGLIDVTRERIGAISYGNLGPFQLPPLFIGARWMVFLYHVAKNIPEFSPEWNQPLWLSCVAYLWNIYHSIGPFWVDVDIMATLLCREGDIQTFYRGILVHPLEPPNERAFTEERWLAFFEQVIQRNRGWGVEFLHSTPDEHLLADPRGSRAVKEFLRGERFKGWKQRRLRQFFLDQKSAMDPIKEEMMMVCWAPPRFLEWCLDIEELNDLKGNWGLN
jgi:hypothetical protein